ncbi:WD40-repeat-containing domain protein [Syncephalis fuscata]|nr:WD40-repeat-containing domain protein [Syncephalis fuscata]
MAVNVNYEDLHRPMLGPENPTFGGIRGMLAGCGVEKNVAAGHVEEQAYANYDFDSQYYNFQARGYARDPSLLNYTVAGSIGTGKDGTGYVGDVDKVNTYEQNLSKATQKSRKDAGPKRKARGDVTVVDGDNAYQGPWAGFNTDDMMPPPPPPQPSEETEEAEEKEKEKEVVPEEPAPMERQRHKIAAGNEETIFHGREEYDYQGRTYMHIPKDLGIDLLGESGAQQCFLPKKQIHTFTGHTKGVSAIRFFPQSGHLLLSAGMDTKIKLWDVYHQRQCLRTFLGHEKAVRDICFTPDGRQFLSASYDTTIKLWDTETGKCISAFSNGKIPYCVRFNPDHPDSFLVGCSDKKITQYNVNTGDIEQEYDQHLGAVNTITFVDENRRFVTTSDDKTLRVWEFGIPVVIKYVAEPDMYSMPAVALHPNNKWLVAQSLDNQILVFGAQDRFKQNRRKRFVGHMVAGYACQPNFSPDGRYLISGDSSGHLWIWDWKTSRILKKMKAHDKVLIDCAWHPHETSKVATASWDGTIKYWD